MPEDHRRVEPRSIVGTGMATDPERLNRIEGDAARRERAWRDAPVEGFGTVLGSTPARGQMADAVEPDRRRRPAEAEAAPDVEPTAAAPTSTRPPPARPERQSPRAPDPRERLLREQLAAQQKKR